jgi:uncharacterized RmlC-like cupin family protein
MTNILLSRAAVLVALIVLAAGLSTPQPSAQLQRIPQFENEHVNVWKTTVPPNAPLLMHTHQYPRVVVALATGTMKTVYQSGRSVEHHWEAGKAYWSSWEDDKDPHADSNTGNKPIEVMVIEVKDATR